MYRRRGWLVDDTQYVQAGYLAGILGCLALAVVEISRYGNDSLGDLFPEVSLGVRLEFLQYHRRNFRRTVVFVAHFHVCVAIISFGNNIREHFPVVFRAGLIVFASHQSLDAEYRIIRIGDPLPFGYLSHQALSGFVNRHHRRCSAAAFRIRDNGRLSCLHDGYRRVGRA